MNCEKFTRNQSGNILIHCNRSDPNRTYKNQDIHHDKTSLNYNLAPEHNMTDFEFMKSRCESLNILKRKDVNWLVSWVVTLPKDYTGNQEQFFKETYNFLSNRYGVENVVSSYVHLDETTPHMHFCFVPVVFDEKKEKYKVNAKLCISKTELKKIHPEIQKYLEEKLHTKVNILNDTTKEENKTIEELKKNSKMQDKIKKELKDELSKDPKIKQEVKENLSKELKEDVKQELKTDNKIKEQVKEELKEQPEIQQEVKRELTDKEKQKIQDFDKMQQENTILTHQNKNLMTFTAYENQKKNIAMSKHPDLIKLNNDMDNYMNRQYPELQLQETKEFLKVNSENNTGFKNVISKIGNAFKNFLNFFGIGEEEEQ